MKKYFFVFAALLVITTASAQQDNGFRADSLQANGPKMHQKAIPSPERNARMETNKMNKQVGLTDEQYQKVYELNLKEQKKLFANANPGKGGFPQGNGMMGGGRPPMGGGPGMGGDPRMGGGPGMGGGMQMMGGRPDMDNFANRPKAPVDMQKLMARKEKKLKKILNAEQYTKWQKAQDERHSDTSFREPKDCKCETK